MSTGASVVIICKSVGGSTCQSIVSLLPKDMAVIADEGGDISEMFGVSRYPVTVLIDSDTRIRAYGYPLDAGDLDNIIAEGVQMCSTHEKHSHSSTASVSL